MEGDRRVHGGELDPRMVEGSPAPDYCHRCGTRLVPESAFCSRCGAPVQPIPEAPSEGGSQLPPPVSGTPDSSQRTPETSYRWDTVHSSPPVSHAGRNGLIVFVVLLLIIGVCLAVPFPDNFSGSFSTNSGEYSTNITSGVTVQGVWSASSSQPVAMAIVGPSGVHFYASTGDAGSFSFASTGGTYVFEATSIFPEDVAVNGTFPATVAQWLADQ